MPTPEQELDEDKRALRRSLRLKRRALSPVARHDAALSVSTRLLAWLDGARCVALYAAYGSELSVAPLATQLWQRGVELAWPRVEGDRLRFYSAAPETLVAGYRGLSEPPNNATFIDDCSFDALVVPGLGFDTHGKRLGQGGGFYDRTLANLKGMPSVGVAFDVQIVETIPCGPHDMGVMHVVTEQRSTLSERWCSG